jgi:hypothetical protein
MTASEKTGCDKIVLVQDLKKVNCIGNARRDKVSIAGVLRCVSIRNTMGIQEIALQPQLA